MALRLVGQCTFHRAHIGAGGFVKHSGLANELLQDSAGIGKLWNDFGVGVGGGFDACKTQSGKAFDQCHFVMGGDHLRFVL